MIKRNLSSMGKNISKILTTSVILSTCLFANSDDTLIDFQKKRFSANPAVEIESIKVNTKKALPVKGWNGYILDISAKVKGKNINAKDIVFFDGQYIAPELIDIKTGKSLKSMMTPDVSAKYYKKSKLIAGNHNAKDKIVVFSDVLCPFCMDYIPKVIEYVNKHKDNIALYYYHFPLTRIHPASDVLANIMEVAKEKGVKDLELKAYTTNWEKYFKSSSTNKKEILEAFNKEFKTDIKEKELSKKIEEMVKEDVKLGEDVMVQGTPTIFVNGKKDDTKTKYLSLGK